MNQLNHPLLNIYRVYSSLNGLDVFKTEWVLARGGGDDDIIVAWDIPDEELANRLCKAAHTIYERVLLGVLSRIDITPEHMEVTPEDLVRRAHILAVTASDSMLRTLNQGHPYPDNVDVSLPFLSNYEDED